MVATTFPKAEVAQLLTARDVDMRQVLLIAETGSTAHGVSISDQDDFDATVVRIERFQELVVGREGLDPGVGQSMMIRTQPDGFRSRMGDIDLNVYTLRKFVNLARKGNPSILAAIFSARRHLDRLEDWDVLAEKVASKRAGHAFLGYLREQINRWQGGRSPRVQRPELVEAYGYDTKYAAHAIRLGYQGIEYMQSGQFTMPMPDDIAGKLRDLRTGGLTEAVALKWAWDVEGILEGALISSPLPEFPAQTDSWVTHWYSHLVPRP